MSVTLGDINLNGPNFFIKSPEIVSGNELKQISNEIFAAAPSTEPLQISKLNLDQNSIIKVDNGLKVFGSDSNLDAQSVKQIATNKASYDVSLSDKAISAIQELNIQAAKLQSTQNLYQKMDGKVYIPAEVLSFGDMKSVFATARKADLFETSNLGKDKRNFAPFWVKVKKEENEEENSGLNLVI